jgi:hypothetical protein
VCTGDGLEHIVASPVAPAGGSQGTGQNLTFGGSVPITLRPKSGLVNHDVVSAGRG